MYEQQKQSKPRHGARWIVLIVARISTEHQDLRSLDDQIALCKKRVRELYGDAVEFIIITSQISGEYLDRQELIQLEGHIESKKVDLVIVEDLGRICRRGRAVDFCEMAEDNDTRLVSINDHIDTFDPGWRNHAFFATMHHEISNKDTASRIKRSHGNRYEQGQMFLHTVYGYHKPEGKSHENDITLDPEAKKVYEAWWTILENGGNYGSVADWLNANKVPTGSQCELELWTPEMVARVTKNTILKGLRQRNRTYRKRINKTGRRRSVKSPPELIRVRFCPHLVAIEPRRYDRLLARLTAQNASFRRKPKDGVDPRTNVPRKRTVWPGQHLICGVCGRMLHYGAHGLMNNLCCSGLRDYLCWNGVSINGPVARAKIIEAIFEAIASLPDFEPALVSDLTKAVEEFAQVQNKRLVEEQARLAKLERQRDNLVKAIGEMGMSESLKTGLATVEADLATCKDELEQLTNQLPETPSLPSMSEIKTMAMEALQRLAKDSEEFGHLLRKWISVIHVLPFQLMQHGQPVQRAYFTLDLTSFLPCKAYQQKFGHMLQKQMVVDLFEMPAREKLRLQIIKLKREGHQHRQVAAMLNTHLPTVQLALKLQTEMEHLGITDPVLPLLEPPSNDNKWRRHKHVRFRFKPLPGYPMRMGD